MREDRMDIEKISGSASDTLQGKTVGSAFDVVQEKSSVSGLGVVQEKNSVSGFHVGREKDSVSGLGVDQEKNIVSGLGSTQERISDEEIENIEILAQLTLTDEEKLQAKSDLEEMLTYIDTLNELDTGGVEPMSHAFALDNVFREDVVTNGDGSTDTLANAPSEKDGMYQVPRTFDV